MRPHGAGGAARAEREVLLVLRAIGLGDLLTGVPALRALADAFPDHHRVLLAPASLAPLALHTGSVDEVVPHVGLDPLPPGPAPDVAVNLHGRGPESHRLLLAGQPRRLIAFAHDDVAESAGGPAWRAAGSDEHEVDRWCRLLVVSGIAADPRRLDLAAPDRPVPPWAGGATVVHPGAAAEARRWPVPRFAEVVAAERADGREVVVTGEAGERDRAEAVARQGGIDPSRVLAGRTDVLELAALIANAGRVVAGDTGVAHLATALGTPSVVLFGPTSPRRWGPPPERAQHRALWAGGTGDPHAPRIDPGLLAIEVDHVLDALHRLPAPPGARPSPFLRQPVPVSGTQRRKNG